jgi:tetratricopeptide (TPR) repeat protein
MRMSLFGVAIGVWVAGSSAAAAPSGSATSGPATSAPAASAPATTGSATNRSAKSAPPAPPLRAPQNIKAVPATQASSELATRAARAVIAGNFVEAVSIAEAASAQEPRDPWPYYDKGDALTALGKTDGAIVAFQMAEQRFAPFDPWGRSIAIYGRAHALSEVGRCEEARAAFQEYATFVEKSDPESANMARHYATDCKSPSALTVG